MIYLDTMAEISIEGNDFFMEGCEDEFHHRFKFLERINKKSYFTTGERERVKQKELSDYMIHENLASPAELREIEKLSEKINKSVVGDSSIDEEILNEGKLDPEGEIRLPFLNLNRKEAEKFNKNLSEMKDFSEKFPEEFEKSKLEFDESIHNIYENMMEYKHFLKEKFKGTGEVWDFSFEEEFNKMNFKKNKNKQIVMNIPDSNYQQDYNLTIRPLSHSIEEKYSSDDNSTREEANKKFDSQMRQSSELTPSMNNKKGSFRLKTKSSKESFSANTSSATALKDSEFRSSAKSGFKKRTMNLAWCNTKDLKDQNEEILRMIERTRKDPAPLQRVPKKLSNQTLPAKKLN